jgi:non-homologous end joining protein Ku
MKIIKAKLKGRKPDLAVVEEPRSAEVVDLMERLRQSLQQAGTKKQAKSGAKRGATRAKKRKAA